MAQRALGINDYTDKHSVRSRFYPFFSLTQKP